MTKKTETVASISERVGNAIKLEEVDIIKDELDAITKADKRTAENARKR
jgi:hypothetical protein